MEDRERDGMIDSLMCRREEPTQYEAPEVGDKMRALYALGLMDLSNGAKAVGAALIWHANSRTGRCDPGLQRLEYETVRCRQTVINAIGELRRKGVVRKKRRGQSTNAYQLNWQFLRGKFQEFESRVTNVTFLRQGYKNLDLGSPEPCTSEVQKLVPEPIKRTHEENPCPERVRQPSADATNIDSFLSEKGVQGQPVGKPSPFTQSPRRPEGPSRAEAETAVSGYCTAFDWEHLSQDAYEAAVAAEIQAPGAGFAVVKAASQEAWRANRKGAVNG
jgi:hypothetical protein